MPVVAKKPASIAVASAELLPGIRRTRPPKTPDAGSLEDIPEVLRRLHRNKRILIVDDFELTLKDVQADLGCFFPESSGNVVEVESDPLRVVELMRAAKDEGMPYDALVLDLRMPGKNGDELLRDISNAGLLCPVVIHSASHAKGVQCQLLPQIDELRTDEVERRTSELEGLDALLGDMKSARALEGLKKTLARKTDGVPARFVLKYGPGYRPEKLSRALEAVLLTGEETDWVNYQTAVARFRPALFDASDYTEYVEELSEVAKFLGKKAGEVIERARSEVPGIVESKRWDSLMNAYGELTGGDYSTEKLVEVMGDSVDLGGVRRHNLPALFGWIGDGAAGVARPLSDDPASDGRVINPLLEGRPDLVEAFMDLNRIAYDLGHMLLMPRCLKENRRVIDLTETLSWCSGFRDCDRTIPQEPVPISSPGILFEAVIEQPIMNAIQHTKDREGGRVKLVLDKARVGELDTESRKYFVEKHGLTAGDEVAHVLVSDNGPGIRPEDLDNIFSAGYTTRHGGTGFGLYFHRRYIDQLNGTCHVDSGLGRGTEFHMYFKLAEKPEQ